LRSKSRTTPFFKFARFSSVNDLAYGRNNIVTGQVGFDPVTRLPNRPGAALKQRLD
jgi:hypothetical protein